jgi:hypothetical protein
MASGWREAAPGRKSRRLSDFRAVSGKPGPARAAENQWQKQARAGLPVIELDKVFWRPGLAATPPDQWIKLQKAACRGE